MRGILYLQMPIDIGIDPARLPLDFLDEEIDEDDVRTYFEENPHELFMCTEAYAALARHYEPGDPDEGRPVPIAGDEFDYFPGFDDLD